MTAEEFADRKFDFPDGGRWTELVAGELETFEPPDDAHGNFVRTLSAALADFAQETQEGYACFELGLIVRRNPDTVRCPPISYFTTGERFAEQDKLVTEVRPALVVEIASTNDRRRQMAVRVQEYLDWGVSLVWVADTHARKVLAFEAGRQKREYEAHQTLYGGSILSGFQARVEDLFADPKWWRS